LGLFLALFIIVFALSGIVLNHRGLLSAYTSSRSWMPSEYQFKNWNNASLKKIIPYENEYLHYGLMGVWKSDSQFSNFENYNQGFPKGSDNRKVEALLVSDEGGIYAATQLGLFFRRDSQTSWEKVGLPLEEERIIDLRALNDTIYILSRSHLITTPDQPYNWNFQEKRISTPTGYSDKIGLFKTLWEIHSGEMLGITGMLIVDLMGLILIFLSFSGIIFFTLPRTTKKLRQAIRQKWMRFNRSNIKWHNKIGIWTVIILVITTATGMFLRPPLLIPIANTKVSKIKYTHLDSPNPWNDKLRRIIHDDMSNRFILCTLDGIYECNSDFSKVVPFRNQPPVSVMGVNILEKKDNGAFLIGSFSGLYLWYPNHGMVIDYLSKQKHVPVQRMGPPISNVMASGYYSDTNENEYLFDYNKGVIPIGHSRQFIKMPETIEENTPMPLWNLALEFHTGRFYKFFLGDFYILVIPLMGLTILFILISGTLVWFKYHYRKPNKRTKGGLVKQRAKTKLKLIL